KPITNEAFVKSMASSSGILCGAGFETPAESLYMQKKLMVVPMKGQYEQQCNAAALADMGVPVIKSLKTKHLPKLQHWLDTETIVPVDYPDITDQIVSQLLEKSLKTH
ncbi:MAG: glycosyltransferase family protein, partial [Maribacter dokdonensis]|uniref:glycosyltransferase family protein n=1 Tax=Maribacter dokdonensis TaxID=320912 RepID=UPI0032984557